jgi:hypothetical protein
MWILVVDIRRSLKFALKSSCSYALGMGNFHDIRRQLNGDYKGPWFVIHCKKRIVGLCLRRDLNPKVIAEPPEVWVGAREPLPEWGDRLANDTGPIPVYVAATEGANYVLLGTYEISAKQPTKEYFAEVKAVAPRGLCRIVYLKKCSNAVIR